MYWRKLYLTNQKFILKMDYNEKDLATFTKKFNGNVVYAHENKKARAKFFNNYEIFLQYSPVKSGLSYTPYVNAVPFTYHVGIRAYVKEGS